MARTIATAQRTTRDELLEFVRPRHRAVLTTYRRDGSLQSSPVACGTDPDGRIVVSTYPDRAKAVNLRRDPRVSLCVLSEDWDGPYVQVDGRAEVLDMPDALEPLVDYFRSISGEHPDWDEYRQAMAAQDKSLLRVRSSAGVRSPPEGSPPASPDGSVSRSPSSSGASARRCAAGRP